MTVAELQAEELAQELALHEKNAVLYEVEGDPRLASTRLRIQTLRASLPEPVAAVEPALDATAPASDLRKSRRK